MGCVSLHYQKPNALGEIKTLEYRQKWFLCNILNAKDVSFLIRAFAYCPMHDRAIFPQVGINAKTTLACLNTGCYKSSAGFVLSVAQVDRHCGSLPALDY